MRPVRTARATYSGALTEIAPRATEIVPQSRRPSFFSERMPRRLNSSRKFCPQSEPKTIGKLVETRLGRMRLVGPIDGRIQRTLCANVDDVPEIAFQLRQGLVEGQQYVLDDLGGLGTICPFAKIKRRLEPWPDHAGG